MGCRERLLREDYPRTKHDAAFSPWKVLIGSSDWEDHKLGLEGAERYRVHNLPKACSSAGVYELGLVGTKLDPDYVVVVYIGQADNVRSRLQKYGRFGAHLETTSGLFTQIFSRGYSIAFRWAPMLNKQDAEKRESQLLATFDYAWNKGSNGVRRVHDVLCKLQNLSSTPTWLPKFIRRLQIHNHKKVGIKIEAAKTPENGFYASTDDDNHKNRNKFTQIFKLGRSRPRLISAPDRTEINVGDSSICGVSLDGEYICKNTPVKGRKRCAEHKGMKICRSIVKLTGDKKLNIEELSISREASPCVKKEPVMRKSESGIVCGVKLGVGFVCENRPIKGRKRCEEHKGMRIKK